jgi:hypothetical protein
MLNILEKIILKLIALATITRNKLKKLLIIVAKKQLELRRNTDEI